MKIFLWFNQRPDTCPPQGHDFWSNYVAPDSTRLAFFCAESWRRAGWKVERFSTEEIEGFDPFQGRLAATLKYYRLAFFNFWFAALQRAPAWFVTTDVFNYGFRPNLAAEFLSHSLGQVEALSLSREFTLSAVWLTSQFCNRVIRAVKNYDTGRLPPISGAQFVHDELIARHFLVNWYGTHDVVAWAMVQKGYEEALLVHCPRCVLSHFK